MYLNFNYEEKLLIVTSDKGEEKTYKDAETYLADWPGREADCVAIGWTKAT